MATDGARALRALREDMAEPRLICHRCGYESPEGDDQVFCPNDGMHLVDEAEHKKSSRDLFLGTTVGDRYPVLGIVGRGGMGAVYRSVQPMVDREVAVKLILPSDGDQDETSRQRFLREARAIAAVAHPSIVTLHDFGAEEDGTLYMVMELVRGHTLRRAVTRSTLSAGEFVDRMLELLEALGFAHSKGLIHRDLKPDNVMLLDEPTEHNLIKVLDFGLARLTGMDTTAGRLTRTGAVFGTPQYMSPEQAAGVRVDERTDVYAVGIMLFEGLTGDVPFDAEEPLVVLRAQIEAPVPDLPASLPAELKEVVKTALAKDRDDRFPDAAAMRKALAAARTRLRGDQDPTVQWQPPAERSEPKAAALAPTLMGRPGSGARRPVATEAEPTEETPLRTAVAAPVPGAADEPASLLTLGDAAGESLRPTEQAALGMAGLSRAGRLALAAGALALLAVLASVGAAFLDGRSEDAASLGPSTAPADPPTSPTPPAPTPKPAPPPAELATSDAGAPDAGVPAAAPDTGAGREERVEQRRKKKRRKRSRKAKRKAKEAPVARPQPSPSPVPLPAPPPPEAKPKRRLDLSTRKLQ